MNKFFLLLLTLILSTFLPTTSNAAIAQAQQTTQLTRNSLEKSPQHKLTLKQKILLPLLRKKLAKAKSPEPGESGKYQIAAAILCFLFGFIGVHRFYLGYPLMGVLYIFTFGLFGLGWFIDLIRLMIPNGLTPKHHKEY